MITIKEGLSGKYFSMGIPDLVLTIAGYRTGVVITVSTDNSSWSEIYSEHLYPVDGAIAMGDLGNLLTPYARQSLVLYVRIAITEEFDGSTTTNSSTQAFTVVYCEGDIPSTTTCDDFTATHFLSLLMGVKTTSMGRLEYLHFVGSDTPSCTAYYADGTTATFEPPAVGGNGSYSTIDVSPSRFTTGGKTLTSYVVTAGDRRQEYEIDLQNPDCAPILIFTNSFGVDELFYCTGKLTKSPEFKRESAYVSGKKKNYKITETRSFKADTGVMNEDMADWLGELMRSPYVRLVKFKNGTPDIGREVVITESKTEQTNIADELPRFTFTYEYAQRNHNVVELDREGRIFDNTFDYTFN